MKQFSNHTQNQQDALVIKQDTDDGLLQVLLKEYELISNSIENMDIKLFQFLAIVLTALAFATGFMVTQKPNFTTQDPWVIHAWLLGAWLLPLLGMMLLSTLMFQGYILLSHILDARILSLRINHIAGEAAIQQHESMTVSNRFFSTPHGNPKIRILYVTLFGSGIIFYFAMIGLSFSIIYQEQGHLVGTVFLTFFVLLITLFGFAASGINSELPKTYSRFFKDYDGSQPIPYYDGTMKYSKRPTKFISRLGLSSSHYGKTLFASVLPRPADVLVKGDFFLFGFVAALIITGFNNTNVQLVNNLFNTLFGVTLNSWNSITSNSFWWLLALFLIYFIVEEILLQQAKLIWDDIRDYGRDKHLLRNRNRAIASGQMTIASAKVQLVLRLVAALFLGYLLGGWALFIVFLLICLHQVIYELWIKPRSARVPQNRRVEKNRIAQRDMLFFLSLSVPLRFLAGVVAVTGSKWAYAPYILCYVLFYFCSFGALAAFWKMEAQYYRKKSQPKQFRSQSLYFLKKGRFWQYVGLLAAVLVSTSMVVIQVLALYCVPVVSNYYGGCTLRSGTTYYTYTDYGLSGILRIFGLIVLFWGISYVLVYLFRLFRKSINDLLEKAKEILFTPLCIATGVSFLLLIPIIWWSVTPLWNISSWNSVLILFLSFFFLNSAWFFLFEGMTYEEYTKDFLKPLPNTIKAVSYLLFVPSKNIGLGRLIEVATQNADPDKWEKKVVRQPIEIGHLTKQEIDFLDKDFPSGILEKHHTRLDSQSQHHVAYLFAWQGQKPLGHVLLKWDGSASKPIHSHVKECPEVEDLFVRKSAQSQGVGNQLLAEAERLAKQHGYTRIGLPVCIKNGQVRSFYEHRGYQDSWLGVFRMSGTYFDEENRQERCWEGDGMYLVKQLF
jgi:GNAT superfamily N-acetyltransferase